MPIPSQMVPLGTPCPDFELPTVDGGRSRLSDFATVGPLAVFFICNHCPYVMAVEDRILALHREFRPRGVGFVAIASNDWTAYPDDAPEMLERRWRDKEYGFPYLIDADQSVARRFQAVCTPDIFLYDDKRCLAYRGRIDDNWKEPAAVRRRDLAEALEALLASRAPAIVQHPSLGCSIKWRTA